MSACRVGALRAFAEQKRRRRSCELDRAAAAPASRVRGSMPFSSGGGGGLETAARVSAPAGGVIFRPRSPAKPGCTSRPGATDDAGATQASAAVPTCCLCRRPTPPFGRGRRIPLYRRRDTARARGVCKSAKQHVPEALVSNRQPDASRVSFGLRCGATSSR